MQTDLSTLADILNAQWAELEDCARPVAAAVEQLLPKILTETDPAALDEALLVLSSLHDQAEHLQHEGRRRIAQEEARHARAAADVFQALSQAERAARLRLHHAAQVHPAGAPWRRPAGLPGPYAPALAPFYSPGALPSPDGSPGLSLGVLVVALGPGRGAPEEPSGAFAPTPQGPARAAAGPPGPATASPGPGTRPAGAQGPLEAPRAALRWAVEVVDLPALARRRPNLLRLREADALDARPILPGAGQLGDSITRDGLRWFVAEAHQQ